MNVDVRSRIAFIAGYLVLTPSCGRLAYETLSLLGEPDAGGVPSDNATSAEGSSDASPTSSLSTPSDASGTISESSRADGPATVDSTPTSELPSSETSPGNSQAPSSGESSDGAPSTTDVAMTSVHNSDVSEPNVTTSDAVSTVPSEPTEATSSPIDATSSTANDSSTAPAGTTSSEALPASSSEVSSSANSTDPSDATSETTSPCTTPGAFLAPTAVTGLPAPAFSPSLSADRLTLYFASSGEIYTATRDSADSLDFSQVTALAAVNTGDNELTPQLSADGLRLYFTRGNDPGRDIYVSTRLTTSDNFGSATLLGPVNTPYFTEMLPRESANGRELFFTSIRDANFFDVWVARRNNISDAYGSPSIVAELTTNADESPGGLSSDGLMMMMASKRTGTLGAQDIWTTTRASTATAFGNVVNEAVLNTTFNELDPTLSADDQELLFSSDRTGNTLIYRALRECAL